MKSKHQSTPLSPGEPSDPGRIGKYRIIARIGEGGQARVYLAYVRGAAGFHKLVVIKVLRDDLTDDMHAQSLRHEARLAGHLNHPNVVQTHEVGEIDGRLFIAMEYVEGQSLGVIQKKLAPAKLPLPIQLRILIDVARALHHAHTLKDYDGSELRIVHRDVSPHNVMIAYDGQVKLVDFGIAKAQGNDELTHEGVIKGKVAYMSPEQLSGAPLDHRADIFALGVMMWQAITGRRFAGGPSVSELTKIHNRLAGREARLREAAPSVPERLIEICDKALSVEPADRHASAEAFADELAEYMADSSLTSQRELAEILRPLFVEEREKMRALVDEEVRTGHTQSGTRTRAARDLPEIVIDYDELATGADHADAEMLEPRPTAKRTSRGLVFLGALAVVAAGTALIAVGRGGDGTAPSVEPHSFEASETAAARSTPAPAAAAASEPAAASATVRLRVTASPAGAVAELDGARVPLPLETTIARGAPLQMLEVRAPGHETARRALSFERDVDLTIELVRARPSPPSRARRPSSAAIGDDPSAASSAPAPAADTLPAIVRETPTPQRRSPQIDTQDPYQ